MNGTSFIFGIVAIVTVASAAMVVFSKNLIYSAMALLFTLLGVAGLYVFLWADFIAVTQILIYVGGIPVSYTHLRAHRAATLSRMPSSA